MDYQKLDLTTLDGWRVLAENQLSHKPVNNHNHVVVPRHDLFFEAICLPIFEQAVKESSSPSGCITVDPKTVMKIMIADFPDVQRLFQALGMELKLEGVRKSPFTNARVRTRRVHQVTRTAATTCLQKMTLSWEPGNYWLDKPPVFLVQASQKAFANRFIETMNTMRLSGAMTDCRVVVHLKDSQEVSYYPAHALVLAASSDYIKTRCTSLLQSAEEKVDDRQFTVSVKSSETVEQLLNYCYTGELDPEWMQEVDHVLELYLLAESWMMSELKNVCCMHFKELLDLESFLPILTLAHHTNHQYLLDLSCWFVRVHSLEALSFQELEMQDLLTYLYAAHRLTQEAFVPKSSSSSEFRIEATLRDRVVKAMKAVLKEGSLTEFEILLSATEERLRAHDHSDELYLLMRRRCVLFAKDIEIDDKLSKRVKLLSKPKKQEKMLLLDL